MYVCMYVTLLVSLGFGIGWIIFICICICIDLVSSSFSYHAMPVLLLPKVKLFFRKFVWNFKGNNSLFWRSSRNSFFVHVNGCGWFSLQWPTKYRLISATQKSRKVGQIDGPIIVVLICSDTTFMVFLFGGFYFARKHQIKTSVCKYEFIHNIKSYLD